MIIRRVTPRTRFSLCAATGLLLLTAWGVSTPRQVDAQGLFKGVQQGAREGNKAAGPVGGVLGGAIGGVGGGFSGVVCVNQKPGQPPAAGRGQKAAPGETGKAAAQGTQQPGFAPQPGGAGPTPRQ